MLEAVLSTPATAIVAPLAAVIAVAGAGLLAHARSTIPAPLRAREDMSSLSWTEVDRVVRSLFVREGFVVNGVRRNSERGVDLVLHRDGERIFVRVDNWKVWNVGTRPLHKLYQLMRREGADHAVVLTAGKFSPEARDYASATGLELVDGSSLRSLVERVEPAILKAA